MNPWKPPSGWDEAGDQDEARALRAAWTGGGVFGAMWRALRGQPLGTFLAVFLLPGLWMVPASIVEERFVLPEDAVFDLGQSLRASAVSVAGYAWNSVSGAAQLSAALDRVRGEPIRWRAFFASVVRAPALLVTTLVVAFPVEAIILSPYPLGSGEALLVVCVAAVVLFFLMIRTLPWGPFVIDTRRPLWEGFAASFAWTRGEFFRLLLLVLFVACLGIPVFVAEWLAFQKLWHVSTAVMGGLYALSVARIYVDMASCAERGAPLAVNASPKPGP